MSYEILIVDDSEVTRKVVRRAVVLSGLEVKGIHEAKNGIEALELLEREWIDVVIADLNMPGMGGEELVGRMAADARLAATPVIVVTSDRNQRRLEELRKRGVRAQINKPFRPETLRDAVARVLEGEEEGGKGGSGS